MSHVTPSASARPARLPIVALAIVLMAAAHLAGGAQAADLHGEAPYAPPQITGGGGGFWAPLVPLRPAPTRFDIYGYPILGPGLLGRPAPHALGVGCPLALEPAYDPDGNLAGYAPLQYCR